MCLQGLSSLIHSTTYSFSFRFYRTGMQSKGNRSVLDVTTGVDHGRAICYVCAKERALRDYACHCNRVSAEFILVRVNDVDSFIGRAVISGNFVVSVGF